MKKKVLAILTTSLLLLSNLNVYAAELPISYNNNWIVSGASNASYTIPYSGNYTVSVSGAQGGSYSSNKAGGKGFTQSMTLWLNKGATVSFSLGTVPDWYKSGSSLVIPAGGSSSFKVNGTTKLTASGGPGRINSNTAIDGVTSVSMAGGSASIHWHTGNGKSGPYLSNTFPQIDSRDNTGGGCYTNHWHVHDSLCVYETWHTHENCREVGHWADHNGESVDGGSTDDGGHSPSWVVDYIDHHCTPHSRHEGDTRNNRHAINCGYSQGQIYNVSHGAEGNNIGVGRYTIQLTESQNLQMYSTTVRFPYYIGSQAYLVLKDDTVSYFKRH